MININSTIYDKLREVTAFKNEAYQRLGTLAVNDVDEFEITKIEEIDNSTIF